MGTLGKLGEGREDVVIRHMVQYGEDDLLSFFRIPLKSQNLSI
jgi:hypothetical protein